MNAIELSRQLLETYTGTDEVVNSENIFLFYSPDPATADHMFPFVTIMTNDVNDQFSNLARPDVYRVNVGISKATFRALFGEPKLPPNGAMGPDGSESYDFTALDALMPHPVYGRQYWVSILNPSDQTFETKVRPLIDEAYEADVAKHDKVAARK